MALTGRIQGGLALAGARFVEAADWDAEVIAAQIVAAVSDDDYRARAMAVAGAGPANGAAETADRLESLSRPPDVTARVRALGSTFPTHVKGVYIKVESGNR